MITSGVGLTGLLLALVGYEPALAMFGGSVVATVAWMALNFRTSTLSEAGPAWTADGTGDDS